ncbi:CLUMA_CG004198, isoform A [Clunio marinus]|uniref:CLUMA_CG004198, isoform A n=1 Tax=Clunio marinus TaxID=568069 RepID=A0A1J1HVE3_9DIPT|nr:CLUMA_CG004198, isoform A [Clunio marinus]
MEGIREDIKPLISALLLALGRITTETQFRFEYHNLFGESFDTVLRGMDFMEFMRTMPDVCRVWMNTYDYEVVIQRVSTEETRHMDLLSIRGPKRRGSPGGSRKDMEKKNSFKLDLSSVNTVYSCGNAGNERLNTLQGEILVAERKLEGLEARIKAAETKAAGIEDRVFSEEAVAAEARIEAAETKAVAAETKATAAEAKAYRFESDVFFEKRRLEEISERALEEEARAEAARARRDAFEKEIVELNKNYEKVVGELQATELRAAEAKDEYHGFSTMAAKEKKIAAKIRQQTAKKRAAMAKN